MIFYNFFSSNFWLKVDSTPHRFVYMFVCTQQVCNLQLPLPDSCCPLSALSSCACRFQHCWLTALSFSLLLLLLFCWHLLDSCVCLFVLFISLLPFVRNSISIAKSSRFDSAAAALDSQLTLVGLIQRFPCSCVFHTFLLGRSEIITFFTFLSHLLSFFLSPALLYSALKLFVLLHSISSLIDDICPTAEADGCCLTVILYYLFFIPFFTV